VYETQQDLIKCKEVSSSSATGAAKPDHGYQKDHCCKPLTSLLQGSRCWSKPRLVVLQTGRQHSHCCNPMCDASSCDVLMCSASSQTWKQPVLQAGAAKCGTAGRSVQGRCRAIPAVLRGMRLRERNREGVQRVGEIGQASALDQTATQRPISPRCGAAPQRWSDLPGNE
jgi:hypothetical protein